MEVGLNYPNMQPDFSTLKLVGGQPTGATGGVPDFSTLMLGTSKPPQQTIAQKIWADLAGRKENLRTSFGAELRGEQGKASTALQVGGQIAGGVSDIFANLVSPIIGPIFKKIGESAKPTEFSKNLGEQFSAAKQLIEQRMEKDPAFATEMRNIGAAGNIGLFLLDAVGLGEAVTGLKAGVGAGLKNLAAEKAEQAAVKSLDDALELTKPVLSKSEKIQAFEKAGKPGGVVEEGMLDKVGVTPDARQLSIAESVKDIVSKSKSPVENLAGINTKIADVSENQVRRFLRDNPRAFNNATLNARLRSLEPSDIIKADPVLERTYSLVRERMMDVVDKSPKTMEGLWDARKEFDQIIQKQFGENAFDPNKNSAVKQAYLDMRRTVNDFISEQIGDATFSENMKLLSNMYEARYNIAEQNYKLLDKNTIQRWIKENPAKAKAIGITAGTIGAGTAASILFE